MYTILRYSGEEGWRGGSAEVFAGELRSPSHQLRNPFILVKKIKDEFKMENYLEMLNLENWKEIAKDMCKNRHTNIVYSGSDL